jgi:hypothetical protein
MEVNQHGQRVVSRGEPYPVEEALAEASRLAASMATLDTLDGMLHAFSTAYSILSYTRAEVGEAGQGMPEYATVLAQLDAGLTRMRTWVYRYGM